MLLHRVGYITADMLFDPLTETIVKYDAQEMRHGFILHTKEYKVSHCDSGLTVFVSYTLNDGSGEEPICAEQEISIFFTEDKENETSF